MAIEIKLDMVVPRTNPVYLPLYKKHDRYLVLMGGGSSGKSVYAAQKVIVRMITEQQGNHRFLVVRKVARTIRDSCFPGRT